MEAIRIQEAREGYKGLGIQDLGTHGKLGIHGEIEIQRTGDTGRNRDTGS